MKAPHHPRIRLLLRDCPEGMTAHELAEKLNARYSTVRRSLEAMPDAYIDRWLRVAGSRGQFSAVWCVIAPPRNCPHPTERTNAEVRTQWNHRHTTL